MSGIEPQTFRVAAQEATQTLASVLRRRLPGKTWSEVRRLVKSRHVTVSGNLCLDAGRRLQAEEVVKVLRHPTAPIPRDLDVRIRYLDAQLVVVEKPAGMTSVRHTQERHWSPRRKQLQPTLEDVLPRVIARQERKGRKDRKTRRPGRLPPVRPVHRLDRDTSGLMVFARTARAQRHLAGQFRRHAAERRYLAIVHGAVAGQTIQSQLVRDRGDGRRGSTTAPHVGKRAVTHVKPLEPLDGYTLVECRLDTGRTHQIRIQLAELGHPVCGETIYDRPLFAAARPDQSGAPRLALHAAQLGIEHPESGESLNFRMPLPGDLAAFLDRLRHENASRRRSRPQASDEDL